MQGCKWLSSPVTQLGMEDELCTYLLSPRGIQRIQAISTEAFSRSRLKRYRSTDARLGLSTLSSDP